MMTLKTRRFFLSALFAVALAATVALLPAEDPAAGGTPPEMSPEEQAMMAQWAKYGTPGPEHAMLAAMAGAWEGTMKMRMGPEAPWQETTFTNEAKMVLEGRYVESTFRCTMGGMPFEGRSFIGYDRASEEYTTIWMDNMSTYPTTMTGTVSPETKQLVEEGQMFDVVTEEWLGLRAVTTIHGPDHHTYEQYVEGPDGEYYMSMVLDYKRVAK